MEVQNTAKHTHGTEIWNANMRTLVFFFLLKYKKIIRASLYKSLLEQ